MGDNSYKSSDSKREDNVLSNLLVCYCPPPPQRDGRRDLVMVCVRASVRPCVRASVRPCVTFLWTQLLGNH